MATHIREWTAQQYRPAGEFKLSDYIYFALKKINVIGEFRLVPREPFERYLEALKGLVLEFCPPAEREALRGEPDPPRREHRGADRFGGRVDPPEVGRGNRRAVRGRGPERSAALSRGVARHPPFFPASPADRKAEAGRGPGRAGSPSDFALALTAAVRAARNPQEFEKNLERLREKGLEVENEDIFRALGSSLPGWVPPEAPAASAGSGGEGAAAAPPAPPESGPVEAMHRIVAQPRDPAEVARRFQAMVKAAVERFNEGALPQAVTMLGLAERIVAEKRVDAATVDAVRQKGDEAIDPETLRRFSEAPRFHSMLGKFLAFFSATSPKGLLGDLLGEMRRDRRRLILQLLEIHGAPAREEALERLRVPFGQAEGTRSGISGATSSTCSGRFRPAATTRSTMTSTGPSATRLCVFRRRSSRRRWPISAS